MRVEWKSEPRPELDQDIIAELTRQRGEGFDALDLWSHHHYLTDSPHGPVVFVWGRTCSGEETRPSDVLFAEYNDNLPVPRTVTYWSPTKEEREAMQERNRRNVERVHELASELLERVHCGTNDLWGDRKCLCPGHCQRPLVVELKKLVEETAPQTQEVAK